MSRCCFIACSISEGRLNTNVLAWFYIWRNDTAYGRLMHALAQRMLNFGIIAGMAVCVTWTYIPSASRVRLLSATRVSPMAWRYFLPSAIG